MKKNHSNHDHFEWGFQSDHDHQKSPKITIPNQMIADYQHPVLAASSCQCTGMDLAVRQRVGTAASFKWISMGFPAMGCRLKRSLNTSLKSSMIFCLRPARSLGIALSILLIRTFGKSATRTLMFFRSIMDIRMSFVMTL